METINLCGEWKLSGTDQVGNEIHIPANVPGCVHTDLQPEYLPENLYWRDNAKKGLWIEEKDWVYKKIFYINNIEDNATLCFEGLDTYCDIFLNGVLLGNCDNMFTPHSFAVDNILKQGENILEVKFYSPIKMVEGKEKLNGAFTTERLHTRRLQCTYSWDWVARFVTCGIWKSVYIKFENEFAVDNSYIYTESIDEYSAQIVVKNEFKNFENGGMVKIEIINPEGVNIYNVEYFTKENIRKSYIDIKDPQLWYPNGYGEQPLYTINIYANGNLSHSEKFGIRTVKILQLKDEKNGEYYNKCLEIRNNIESINIYEKNEEFSGFILLINGIKILCTGANWVPCEPFPSEESDQKITRILELSKNAGVNMVRVWGGGIFEHKHFYEECDRLGILVTQDFLMACGNYPEKEEWFRSQLVKEAEFAAKYLRNHPCLVWWSGDNENAVMGSDKDEDYTGRTAALNAIGPVLEKHDPMRRFLASSPYGGTPYASKTSGTTHHTQYLSAIWPYIENSDFSDYKDFFRKFTARFIAEEGTMGAISESSLKKFMTEDDIWGENSEMWYYHTQSNPALKKELLDYTLTMSEKTLGKFIDNADRNFKLRYNQYEYIRITLENTRANQWFSSGIIYWMLNDCWPASSGWALIDYYGIPKASFYSFKRSKKPIIASLVDKNNTLEVFICNNSLKDENVTVTLSILEKDGTLKEFKNFNPLAPANDKIMAYSFKLNAFENAPIICEVNYGTKTDRAFHKNGTLDLVPTDKIKVIGKTENSITLKADTYIHAVELGGDCIFDDNYFSLLKDEERCITYQKIGEEDALLCNAYTFKDVL